MGEKDDAGKLASNVQKLAKSKAKGPEQAKNKEIQSKVAAFVADLKAKAEGAEQLQKEINELKTKKTALTSKLDTYNKKIKDNFFTHAKAAMEVVNAARGKVSKEDAPAITDLWNILSKYQYVPVSLKLDE
jgi:predicted  nucleic acid-binding Zn-ribbon protein